MAAPTKRRALNCLERATNQIYLLKNQPYSSQSFNKWQLDTLACIANSFGEDSRQSQYFTGISYSPTVFSSIDQEKYNQEGYLRGLDDASTVLASMIDEINEFWEDEEQAATTSEIQQVIKPIDAKRVFIVHGRNHGTRDMVARFIQALELEPVILQEQPNQGLTIIEKFEKYALVGFAVVLFTPDDIGAIRNSADAPQFRARQNVIFELGYLIRHLGRGHVAVLYNGDEGDIEIPSDYAGVVYTQLDDGGGWRFALIGEMKSAGLDVDANRVFLS